MPSAIPITYEKLPRSAGTLVRLLYTQFDTSSTVLAVPQSAKALLEMNSDSAVSVFSLLFSLFIRLTMKVALSTRGNKKHRKGALCTQLQF